MKSLKEDYGWMVVDDLPTPDIEEYLLETRQVMLGEERLLNRLRAQLADNEREEMTSFYRVLIEESQERRSMGFHILHVLRDAKDASRTTGVTGFPGVYTIYD